jgi:hypothetical protein
VRLEVLIVNGLVKESFDDEVIEAEREVAGWEGSEARSTCVYYDTLIHFVKENVSDLASAG